MSLENTILANISITAILPVIIIFLKLVFDTAGMYKVEKITLTNFKKVTIYSAQILLLTFVAQFIFMLFGVSINSSIPNIEPLLIHLISLFIIISLAFLLVSVIGNVLGIKVSFYILDHNNREKWFFRRMISKNRLLLSSSNNSYKFIDLDSLNNLEVFRMYEKRKVIFGQTFIYKNSTKVLIVLGVLLLITSLIGWNLAEEYHYFDLITTLFLLTEYFCTMYVFTAINNERLMKEVDEEFSNILR